MFKIGDKVSWSSQAAGSRKNKVGEVVAVVKPGEDYTKAVDRLLVKVRKDCSYAFGGGFPRKETSFIVKVPGATAASKSKLYWPRTSALFFVE